MGLSVGAKAGVAIGSVAVVCITALLAYIAILMRRMNKGGDAVGSEAEHKMPELGPGLAHEMEIRGREGWGVGDQKGLSSILGA
jgi:hypothetical protein